MDFDTALAFVLEWEGGYANHPRDPGGATNYGITQRTARAYGYPGSMRDIPMAWVRTIYKKGFWDACRCDELPEYYPLRLAVFDAAVNSGPVRSIGWLQQAAGATVDGKFGKQTLGAVLATPPALLAASHLRQRQQFLRGLKTWRTFGRGWTRRLDAVAQVLTEG